MTESETPGDVRIKPTDKLWILITLQLVFIGGVIGYVSGSWRYGAMFTGSLVVALALAYVLIGVFEALRGGADV